tara:strand:- start:1317 stop:1628 length:312 start_codon:yes stop_codon:yes gene_type:complete
MISKPKFNSFKEFYPFYLSEHSKRSTKILHMIGSIGVILMISYSFYSSNTKILYYLPIVGYGFAWIGHFFFEKNRPATFTYPLYSFAGDWIMLKDIFLGKVEL